MTLPALTIDAVRRLLARGVNYRQIARQLKGRVSRGAVREIAQALMRYNPKGPPRKYNLPPIAEVGKCPSCNYRVELPCKICAARAWRHIRRLRYLRRHANKK
jgi:hypothetical protein